MTPCIKLLNPDEPYEKDFEVPYTHKDLPEQASLILDTIQDQLLQRNPLNDPLPRRTTVRQSIVQAITDLNPLKTKTKKNFDVPILEWVDLYHEGRVTASVLIAVELIEIHFCTNLIPTVEYVAGIPQEIAPEMVQLK